MKGKNYANRKPQELRPENDFYETPSCMVRELLNSGVFPQTPSKPREQKDIRILDPCCGHYAIGNVLREYGYINITEKDIMYGDDFLEKNENGDYVDLTHYDLIIMNPPFSKFDEFVRKAKMQAKYVLSIGKMNFFGAHNRNVEKLWDTLMLVLPFDRMIAFDKPEVDGKVECGMIVSCWMFWDSGYKLLPMIKVLDMQKYIRKATR